MKTLILALLLVISNIFAQSRGFVHPLDFNGTEIEKQKVIKFIGVNVKEQYSKIGLDDAVTLRMMEKAELKAFKELTKVNNRSLLDKVIKTYCEIGMCNYQTILMMYKEQAKASQEELRWE